MHQECEVQTQEKAHGTEGTMKKEASGNVRYHRTPRGEDTGVTREAQADKQKRPNNPTQVHVAMGGVKPTTKASQCRHSRATGNEPTENDPEKQYPNREWQRNTRTKGKKKRAKCTQQPDNQARATGVQSGLQSTTHDAAPQAKRSGKTSKREAENTAQRCRRNTKQGAKR